MAAQKTITIFYHFFHPDPVISARLYTDIAVHLRDAGWKVIVYTSNKQRHESLKDDYSAINLDGIEVHRLWHPSSQQNSVPGRLLNTMVLLIMWTYILLIGRVRSGVLLLGTDPPMSVVLAVLAALRSSRLKIAHWCFDLYPELLIAESMLSKKNPLYTMLYWIVSKGYASCDVLVDIGPCMRSLLDEHHPDCIQKTIVPFALIESESVPDIPDHERRYLFHEARLGILYSGSLGRGHVSKHFQAFLEGVVSDAIRIAFSVPDRHQEKAVFGEVVDRYVQVVGFARESQLMDRLCAADIHIVSLKESWTGMVIPSKFFGSMSMGRPVLFFGSRASSLAQWITDYELGWIIEHDEDVAHVIQELQRLSEQPKTLHAYRLRAHQFYQEHCRKELALREWETLLDAQCVEGS